MAPAAGALPTSGGNWSAGGHALAGGQSAAFGGGSLGILTVVVMVAAVLLAAGWLASAVERVAVDASGPCAGEPALAWASGSPVARPVAGPAAVGVAAAVLTGVLALMVGPAPVLPAFLLLAGVGLVLAPVDVRTHRLPDAITLPAYPALAGCLSVAALWEGMAPLARAAEGGLAAFGVLYLLALAAPVGFGYGDVKLTGLLGAGLGWYGWPVLLHGLVLGFVYGGLCAAALLATRRADRRANLAFGPFLLAGALTAVVLG